jgi:hypothetical protein
MPSRKIFPTNWFKPVLLGAMVAVMTCAVAAAQDDDRPRFKNGAHPQAVAPAATAADAPNARLVALVRAPDGVVVMQKGVQSVTRIARGVYCIRPAASAGIIPALAVVVVSVEYFYSLYNEVTVQWARAQNGCPAGSLGVYTLADENLDGVYRFSNAVGFVVYIP